MKQKFKGKPLATARHNNNARGFAYTDERRKKMTGKSRPMGMGPLHNRTDSLNRLNVYGTCDPSASGMHMFLKTIKIPHPTDYGYFKEVKVFNDMGKRLYQRKKNEYKHKHSKVN